MTGFRASSGVVEFATPVEQLLQKLPLVSERDPEAIRAIERKDEQIKNALWSWAPKRQSANKFLKTPEGVELTRGQLDLAGWIMEYSKLAKLPFKAAMIDVFEYLQRGRRPELLAEIAGGDVDFAEAASAFESKTTQFAEHHPDTARYLLRYRVYQAAHPGCSFYEAVQALGEGCR